jgi:hypothetical protein
MRVGCFASERQMPAASCRSLRQADAPLRGRAARCWKNAASPCSRGPWFPGVTRERVIPMNGSYSRFWREKTCAGWAILHIGVRRRENARRGIFAHCPRGVRALSEHPGPLRRAFAARSSYAPRYMEERAARPGPLPQRPALTAAGKP